MLDTRVAPIDELDEVEELLGPLAHPPRRHAEVAPVDEEILEHGQLEVEVVVLRNDAETLADGRPVALWIEIEDRQLAPGAWRHCADHPHRGALAGAVGPEEAECLALLDGEVDAVDRVELAEAFPQPSSDDRRRARAHLARLAKRRRGAP